MQLKEHIKEIQDALRAGRFLNESAVSQGIVLRLLQALEWPVFDSEVVCPEYSLEGRRVDFALCHPKGKPAIFIEVKQVGQGEGADRQLFEYAFHTGVPMAVLTDGQEWHFYLPAERGLYPERRVYKLDLLGRDIDESVQRLIRYLTYQQVCSGESLNAARTDYKNVARSREIKDALPLAWEKIVKEQDSLLVDLIADEVENVCGYKPDPDIVANFLKKQPLSHIEKPDYSVTSRSKSTVGEKPKTRKASPESGRMGFVLQGREFKARNARDVFIKVMEQLSTQDSGFLERFAARPRHGAKRRYVARTAEELYPGRPDLCPGNSYELKSGWWVGTHYSKRGFRKILNMACEVAGFSFGTDLVIYLGD